jgi:DNA polymerase-3 subunit epsilon
MNGIYTVIDVETTGLDPCECRIVEFGAITFDRSGLELGRFCSLVNPGVPIPPDAGAIHGITDAMVANAPTIGRLLSSIWFFCRDYDTDLNHPCTLIGHNLSFDMGFINEANHVNGIMTWTGFEFKCTQAMARSVLRRSGSWPVNYRLGTVADFLEVTRGTSHRAMGDCETTKAVFLKLLDIQEGKS